MKRKAKARRKNRQKTKLGLPDLEHVKSAVLVSLRSPEIATELPTFHRRLCPLVLLLE